MADPACPPRDLAGYGPTPPDPAWPNGARLALNLVVNNEEGAEYCPLNGTAIPKPSCPRSAACYAEGETSPRMMTVAVHPRLIGRPGRIQGLACFLEHVAKHNKVWICQRNEIARHWAAKHPVEG